MLCLTCNRVRPAQNPEEYTVLRAQSITVYGLCTCAQPAVWLPEAYGAVIAANSRDPHGT